MAPRLILFDIDQTLINSAGCGRRAMQSAFQEVLLISNALEGITLTGKTDPQIVYEALEKANLLKVSEKPRLNSRGLSERRERDALLQAMSPKKDLIFWERYVIHLHDELKRSTEAHVEPGIIALLDHLSQSPNTFIGLLTGNIQNGAKAKLKRFELWNYFQVGGFGNDHPNRNVVAEIALKRCRQHFNIPFDIENVYVIGDSLRDIACANAIKAKAIAVATGLDSYEELKKRNPFALFSNFSDIEPVLRALHVIPPQGKPDFETNPSPNHD